jgi:methylmalonyl-CoA/ethylmalonyl-CoA epimerase
MLKKIHHVGIVVRSIEAAYAFYRDTLSLPVHKQDIIPDQGVKAALLTIGTSEIELLEPLAAHTGVARFLERRGEGLHHLCFETDDIVRELEATKAKGVAILDQHPRPGLAGMICFLHPKASHGVLIEYAQPEWPPNPEPTPLGLGSTTQKGHK